MLANTAWNALKELLCKHRLLSPIRGTELRLGARGDRNNKVK